MKTRGGFHTSRLMSYVLTFFQTKSSFFLPGEPYENRKVVQSYEHPPPKSVSIGYNIGIFYSRKGRATVVHQGKGEAKIK